MAGVAAVSAQQALIDALAEHPCCFSREDAEKLVDAVAHSLAEKIRADDTRACAAATQVYFADLIDPEPAQ